MGQRSDTLRHFARLARIDANRIGSPGSPIRDDVNEKATALSETADVYDDLLAACKTAEAEFAILKPYLKSMWHRSANATQQILRAAIARAEGKAQ